jgi:hypothetical protein
VAAPRSPTPRQRASHKDFTGKPCLDISPPRFCLTDPRKRGRMIPLIARSYCRRRVFEELVQVMTWLLDTDDGRRAARRQGDYV